MWGSPGTMLAAATMLARTGDPRFAEAWYDGAERLWAHWNEDSLWIQQLYGRRIKSLGPAHGFAGVVRVLVQGGGFLEAIKVRVANALEANGDPRGRPRAVAAGGRRRARAQRHHPHPVVPRRARASSRASGTWRRRS